LMVNRIQGGRPRLCFYESGPDRCIAAPAVPDNKGWTHYQAELIPDSSATAITLYLYADAPSGNRSVDDYANIDVVELPTSPSIQLLADPLQNTNSVASLLLTHTSFSDQWRTSTGAKHVLVDGMLNGWLIPVGSRAASYYGPTDLLRGANGLSLVAIGLVALFVLRRMVVWQPLKRIIGRRRQS
jgi:hypothetical protein